jgi:hypothetical protein
MRVLPHVSKPENFRDAQPSQQLIHSAGYAGDTWYSTEMTEHLITLASRFLAAIFGLKIGLSLGFYLLHLAAG